MGNKRNEKAIVIIITVIFLIMITGYIGTVVWGVSTDDSTPDLIKVWILGIVVLILCPIIIMMIVIAARRQKEIDQEDEDDLSKY